MEFPSSGRRPIIGRSVTTRCRRTRATRPNNFVMIFPGRTRLVPFCRPVYIQYTCRPRFVRDRSFHSRRFYATFRMIFKRFWTLTKSLLILTVVCRGGISTADGASVPRIRESPYSGPRETLTVSRAQAGGSDRSATFAPFPPFPFILLFSDVSAHCRPLTIVIGHRRFFEQVGMRGIERDSVGTRCTFLAYRYTYNSWYWNYKFENSKSPPNRFALFARHYYSRFWFPVARGICQPSTFSRLIVLLLPKTISFASFTVTPVQVVCSCKENYSLNSCYVLAYTFDTNQCVSFVLKINTFLFIFIIF